MNLHSVYACITFLGFTLTKKRFACYNYKNIQGCDEEGKGCVFENAADRQLFWNKKIIRDNHEWLLNGAGVCLEKYSLQPYPHNLNFRFLFIDRIMKEKGIDELLSTLQTLRIEGEGYILTSLAHMRKTIKSLSNRRKQLAEIPRLLDRCASFYQRLWLLCASFLAWRDGKHEPKMRRERKTDYRG